MELNKYGIDIVRIVKDEEGNPGIQVFTYGIVGRSAEEAYHRFMDGGDFPIIFEGEVVDRIVIGIGPAE